MKEIKAGTVLIIDDYFIEELEAAVEDGVITIKEHSEFCSDTFINWFPLRIKFTETRTDRIKSYLTWSHINNDLSSTQMYNLIVFEKLGYNVIKPEQYEISLCDASDHLLTPKELVHKHFIKKCNTLSKFRTWSEGVLNMIDQVMDEHNIIFYKP